MKPLLSPRLQTVILYSEAKKEDNVGRFSTDLDALIVETYHSVQELKNLVRTRRQEPVVYLSFALLFPTVSDRYSVRRRQERW